MSLKFSLVHRKEMLRSALKDLKFEKMQVVTVEEKCDKEHVY